MTHSQTTTFQSAAQSHTNLVYNSALPQLRDPGAAEDATQAVFLILLRKLPTLPPSRPLAPWLLTVTRFVCKDSQKRDRRRRTHERRAAMSESQSAPTSSKQQSIEHLLDAALATLPTHEHSALTLRFLQQLDIPSVAAALSIPPDTARKRITRGLTRLRDYFHRHEKNLNLSTLATTAALSNLTTTLAPAHLSTTLASLSPTTASTTALLLAKSAAGSLLFTAAKIPLAIAALLLLTTTLFIATRQAASASTAPAATLPPGQGWVHLRFDAGESSDMWNNLQTGELFKVCFNGDLEYFNHKTNHGLYYYKNTNEIEDESWKFSHPPWQPTNAWNRYIVDYLQIAAAPDPRPASPHVTISPDTLNNLAVLRIDIYDTPRHGPYSLDGQLWFDPHSQLPLRVKGPLSSPYREQFQQDSETGDFDYPATGPTDLYALGLPHDATPIARLTSLPTTK